MSSCLAKSAFVIGLTGGAELRSAAGESVTSITSITSVMSGTIEATEGQRGSQMVTMAVSVGLSKQAAGDGLTTVGRSEAGAGTTTKQALGGSGIRGMTVLMEMTMGTRALLVKVKILM